MGKMMLCCSQIFSLNILCEVERRSRIIEVLTVKKFHVLYLQNRLLSIFYNMINDMLSRAMSGKLLSTLSELLFSAIALRPKFFLSISNILKNVLGRLVYFLMISLKFDGIRVHCRSSKLKMTPLLFFANMQTSTFSLKSICNSSELEMFPIRVP